jgi:hypothetical protein
VSHQIRRRHTRAPATQSSAPKPSFHEFRTDKPGIPGAESRQTNEKSTTPTDRGVPGAQGSGGSGFRGEPLTSFRGEPLTITAGHREAPCGGEQLDPPQPTR